MKKAEWDKVFDALFDGVKKIDHGLVEQARRQRYQLDDFIHRIGETDVDASSMVYKFDSVRDPGPLAKPSMGVAAQNFSGGKYDATVLSEDLVLFRGGDSNELGQYFTESPPLSEVQSRIDYAVEKHWLDSKGHYQGTSIVDTGHAVLIPQGTTIYSGPTAGRGGALAGGGEQIFIEKPWNIPGVQHLASWPLT